MDIKQDYKQQKNERSPKRNRKDSTSPSKKKEVHQVKVDQIVNKTQNTESTQSGQQNKDSINSPSPFKSTQNQLINTKNKDQIQNEQMRKHIKDKFEQQQNRQLLINENTGSLLGNRFQINFDILGQGSFGQTHIGQDLKKNKDVAIKIMLNRGSVDQFIQEATVMRSLNYMKAQGFPHLIMSAYNENICVLVMDLFGQNLETIRKKYQKLVVSVVCSIGIQMINRLESLHQTGFLHRDIKPQNILMGQKNSSHQNKLYLIDFGLSSQYLDEKGHHIKNIQQYSNCVVGTALFASINAHKGKELSRRDDIESLFYTLIYLLTGTLPWKNINIKNKRERHQMIQSMKEDLAKTKFLQENMEGVPIKFFSILEHASKLHFDQQPDYIFLKSILQKIIKKSYDIKKISDIDIYNNNYENYRRPKQEISFLDIVQQICLDPMNNQSVMNSNQNSEMNEHLIKSELEGRSNHMNTQELKEEMVKQFSPNNLKSIIYGKIQGIKEEFGEIMEEEEEDSENDNQNNEEIKQMIKKLTFEDNDDEIPDDDDCAINMEEAYIKESKENHLQQITCKQR